MALALLVATPLAAQAVGDAKAGAEVFKRCVICHTVEKGGGDALGPNLFGVMGRKAATKPGFAFSGPLQKSGLTWNEANLTKWVAGPQRMVPGNKMAFPGLTSKKQQADVVAYLGTLK
jgi:cytochrome c